MTGTLHPLAPLAAGTRALVLGLGRTGLSAARYLDRKGLTVRVADTRANPPGVDALRANVPAAELRTGAFNSSLLDDVAQVVISPGLSLQEPVVRAARERGFRSWATSSCSPVRHRRRLPRSPARTARAR